MITAKEITALMRDRGWNQSELARQTGLSQSSVHRWLQGAIPDPPAQEVLRKLMSENKQGRSAEIPQSATGFYEPGQLFHALEGILLGAGHSEDDARELLKACIAVAQASLPAPTPEIEAEIRKTTARLLAEQVLGSTKRQED